MSLERVRAGSRSLRGHLLINPPPCASAPFYHTAKPQSRGFQSFSAMASLHDLPKTVPPTLGTKCSNIRACGAHSTFKTQQHWNLEYLETFEVEENAFDIM